LEIKHQENISYQIVPAARVNRAPITPHLLVIEQLNRNDLALATMHGGEVYRVGTDA